ncbi:hypothetical protein PHMEG_00035416, partial [Phytophthora megakarya]
MAVRVDALLAAQLQATIQSVNAAKQRPKPATTVSTAVKAEAGARATKAPVPKSSDDAKVKAKKATPKARTSRKARRGGYPSDSDPSSEDDDSDSSSDDSDSSFCEPLSDIVVPKTTQGGTTTMTIRPFVTASSLDDFDEKASLSERTRWWERFQTFAFQGGWSDKMKVYELHLKLSSSARNWRSQLSPHVRRDWTRFSKEFKVKYSDRADIRYKKSERRREQHVKRFTHRLADSQLKSILKSQRFKSMDDLEYVLKQQEDDWYDDRQSGSSIKAFKVKYCKSKMSDSEKYYTMNQRKAETPLDFLYRPTQEDNWDDDRQSSSSTKAREFRADNLRQGRLRTKYPGRAYVTQSGDESDSDERYVMFEDETLEISPAQESVESHKAPPENQGLGMTMEELTQHVLKVMENSGWNKPEHMAHQGKARQSNGHPGSPSP